MQELEFKSCWPFCDNLFLNSCSFNLSSHKEMYAASNQGRTRASTLGYATHTYHGHR